MGTYPATLAMTAATLHQVSTGRYVLGLGASTRALVEGFHDLPFTRPAARLREVTKRVRALLDGEPAQLSDVAGARPLRLAQPAAPELPIWLAALGDGTIRVAAELADGWFPAFASRDGLASRVAQLSRLRAAVGRQAKPFAVVAGPMTVVDQDADAARSVAASWIAWYLCAMGDVYARFVADQGYGAEVQAILAANPQPSPRHGVVPAEAQVVLDQLTVHGTAEQVRDQLEPWDHQVDIVMIGLPAGLPWPSLEATLRAAAP